MHAVWSRTVQPRPCGCRSCGRAVNLFTRRQATTGPFRRKVTFADIFTACYTTILGTAAILDARTKDKRAIELDRQIAEAKEELAQLLDKVPQRGTYYDYHKEKATEAAWNRALGDHLSEICAHPNRYRKNRRVALSREQLILEHMEQLRSPRRKLKQCVTTGYEASLYKALMAEEENPKLEGRECKNCNQLDAAREETLSMAEKLLVAAYKMEKSQDRKPKCEAINQINDIRSQRYPRFLFTLAHPGEFRAERRKLNQINHNILVEGHSRGPFETVSRVCYNLLVARFPPSTQNYNALLYGFHRLGWHNLTDVVVESFYRTPLLRSSSTIVCLLHHYRAIGDMVKFYTVIAQVVAAVPDGAKVRRRHWRHVKGLLSLRQWAVYSDVRAYRWSVTERMPRDAAMLEAIIQGLLYFLQVGDAIHVFSNALYQGFRLAESTIRLIFDQCIASVDRQGSVRLLGVLTTQYDAAMKLGVFDVKALSKKFSALLELLGLKADSTTELQNLELIGICPRGFKRLCAVLPTSKQRKNEGQNWRFRHASIHGSALDRDGSHPWTPTTSEWVIQDVAWLRRVGGILDDFHKASQTTWNLLKAFHWLVRILPESTEDQELIAMIADLHNPRTFATGNAVHDCISIIKHGTRLEHQSVVKPTEEPILLDIKSEQQRSDDTTWSEPPSDQHLSVSAGKLPLYDPRLSQQMDNKLVNWGLF